MIMGVSSILLAVTFLVSAVPCLYLHMRRQNQLLKYWMNLEDYDEAVARQHSEEAEKGNNKKYDKDNKGRSRSTTRSLPRRGLLDRRLTNMMFGGGYDDRENKKGKVVDEKSSQVSAGVGDQEGRIERIIDIGIDIADTS